MYTFVKRFFDLFFSILGLILISPIFLILIIILKFTGEGEIFYFQERIGLRNKKFKIFKFATMLKDSQNFGNKTHTVRNDPRITKVGRFLRLSKINELPQVLNVINGTMSVVGPRPLIESSFNKYPEEVKRIIYLNRPGITGLGSLIFRDEEKLVTIYKDLGGDSLQYYRDYIFPYKAQLEKWYFENRSFQLDFLILFLTFYSLINKNNNLIFSVFKTIPNKPEILTENGIKTKLNEK
jgi:lipopolysaccharide/colanic/teichoic acid biosynthesis glycosyltransferase